MSTIKKVAEASGVSTATVSYVLNNGPRRVKHETRNRVFAAMRDLNYHPSAIARRMQGKRVNTIGVVALHPIRSVFRDTYFNTVISGIIDSAGKLGQSVMIFNGDQWTDPDVAVPALCDGRCDGLLILVAPVGDRTLSELKLRSVPFITVNEAACDPDVSSVDIDNIGAAKQIVNYLIDKGHRRIAHFSGDDYYQSSIDRLNGYRLALEEGDIPYDPELVYPGHYDYESGYERASKFPVKLRETSTALFCSNDDIALGAIRGLAANNVRVPEDISICGINGLDFTREHHQRLTTMDQDLEGLADFAVETLMKMIAEGPGEPVRVVRSLTLREGDTVKSLPLNVPAQTASSLLSG